MADSYITYDSFVQPESPGYFRKHFDQIFSFSGNELENEGFTPNQGVVQNSQQVPVRTNYDAFSNDSTYSTNPSSKHSPEYTPNAEEGEDDRHKHSIVPPIIKKGIRKYYEPIVDGGVVHRYEDDPNEYRKARKRIQNRESATRVRNRKKTHVEVLEDEIIILKQEKNDLKIQNSSLIAENTMLKQQIGFLESMVAKNNQDNVIEFSESIQDVSRNEQPDTVLQFMNNREEEQELVNMQSRQTGIYRVAPAHNKVKKHMVMLGVFTLLLCVYGLLPRTSAGAVSLFGITPSSSSSSNGMYEGTNSNAVSMNPSQRNQNDRPFEKRGHYKKHGGKPWLRDGPDRPKPFNDWLKSQTENKNSNTESSNSSSSTSNKSYLWMLEVLVIVCYFAYLTYVGWTVYRGRSDKKEKKTSILEKKTSILHAI